MAMDRSYRLYSLSDQGRITGAVNRDFIDDAEALFHARLLLDNYPAIELWQTDRLVARVERAPVELV
jgi:hypothetical protein